MSPGSWRTVVVQTADPLWPACAALRHRVFCEGQGIDAALEADGRDGTCHHVAVLDDAGAVVGTARLRRKDGEAKAERVAVAPEHQGFGIGRALMDALEAIARDGGHSRLFLHAQDTAIPFYDRLGYERLGEPFYEAGVLHRAMARSLLP